ncbi:MAG: cob(I)yrinic acid a,c-diamide adenosyltransferase [Phycisphaerae bacterium]|nr:cob(I)yrinic acid a,c-diamide adenosyltransferase [Phycisphaerae bacterium]
MALYTRRGDEGQSDRGSHRVRKCDPFFEALGTLDELSAHLGDCVRTVSQNADAAAAREALAPLQAELRTLAALVAHDGDATARAAADGAEALAEAVRRMEARIDADEQRLGELSDFVLPGGAEAACRLHLARTVCRRAERRLVAAAAAGVNVPSEALRYVNRLGDLLFSLARSANDNAG